MQTALHRPVASTTKEAAGNAVEASQIVRAAIVAETPGAAPVVKETAGNVCRTISRVQGFTLKNLYTPMGAND